MDEEGPPHDAHTSPHQNQEPYSGYRKRKEGQQNEQDEGADENHLSTTNFIISLPQERCNKCTDKSHSEGSRADFCTNFFVRDVECLRILHEGGHECVKIGLDSLTERRND